MSLFYTKSSRPRSNPQTSKRPLSAPSLLPMTASSPNMDWTQIMIKYTCASCLNWATRLCPAEHCTKSSNLSSMSLGSRSNSTQMLRSCRISPGILTSMVKEKQWFDHNLSIRMFHGVDQGALRLGRSMMQETKVQESVDNGTDHGSRCRVCQLGKRRGARIGHRRGRPQGRRKGHNTCLEALDRIVCIAVG